MSIFKVGKFVFWGGLGMIFMILTLSLLVVYYLEVASKAYFEQPMVMPNSPISKTNAVYLEHKWVGEKVDVAKVAQLATLLEEANITDIFVHSGPFAEDGSLPASLYPHAKYFISTLKNSYPELHIQAWLGQVRKNWGGPLELNSVTIEKMKNSVNEILKQGFDGVHLNIEPILNNDTEFLSLLDELETLVHGQKKILSVSADDVEPFSFGRLLVKLYSPDITMWDLNFFQKVLQKVDQIVIMSYDSGFTKPHYYAMYVESLARALVGDKDHTVFIGIPTYDKPGKKFHPDAENMHSSLLGMIAATKNLDLDHMPHIAIYAYWETSKSEWEEYFKFWLGKTFDERLTIN